LYVYNVGVLLINVQD